MYLIIMGVPKREVLESNRTFLGNIQKNMGWEDKKIRCKRRVLWGKTKHEDEAFTTFDMLGVTHASHFGDTLVDGKETFGFFLTNNSAQVSNYC